MTHFVTCGDCGSPMRIVEHPHKPGVRFYGCSRFPDCRATHGCHPDGSPLGKPANAETRAWRKRAHQALDQLWEYADQLYSGTLTERDRKKLRGIARGRAYRWLAEQLGVEEVHIGALGIPECRRVIEACEWFTAADLRDWAKRRKAGDGKR